MFSLFMIAKVSIHDENFRLQMNQSVVRVRIVSRSHHLGVRLDQPPEQAMGVSFLAAAAVGLEEVGRRQSPPQSMRRFAQAYIGEAVWDIGVEVRVGSCSTRRQKTPTNQCEREPM